MDFNEVIKNKVNQFQYLDNDHRNRNPIDSTLVFNDFSSSNFKNLNKVSFAYIILIGVLINDC